VAADAEVLFDDAIAVIEETAGRLNFNDGLIVALQRTGSIGEVATMDAGFDLVADFRRAEA
jgi:predicted nucleic acid-binding protein